MSQRIDVQRAELQRLYLAVIEADGMPAVHRLLSSALIARRIGARTMPKSNRPRKLCARMEWRGEDIELGPAMGALRTERQRLFVLHRVHDRMSITDAATAAGYQEKKPGGAAMASPAVRAALAEERRREA